MDVSMPKEDLRRRIHWYISLRWFFVLALGFTGIVPQLLQEGFVSQVNLNLAFLASILAINGVFLIINSRPNLQLESYQTLAVSQLIVDLLLMTVVVYGNGGIENIVFMIYVIPIFMSGALLGRRAIYLTGIAAAVLYNTVLALDYFNIAKPQNILAPELHTQTNYFIQTLFFAPAMLLTVTVIADFVGKIIRERTQLSAKLDIVTAQQAELQSIIQSMGSALVAIDQEGKIMLVNDSFEELTGWSRHEVLGADVNKVLPLRDENGKPVQLVNRPLMQTLNPVHSGKMTVRHVSKYFYARKNGSLFPFIASLAPIVVGGKITGATTVFDDASSVKQVQQLKSNFVALASHQLKTPIAEIQGYAENMIQGITGPLNEKQLEYLHSIQEITIRCTNLIGNLLDITITEQGNMVLDLRSVWLNEVVRQGLEVYQERLKHKKIEIKVIKPEQAIIVWADKEKMVEVFTNVLANAIRYSKIEGLITVEIKTEDKFGLILVSDQGQGMSKEFSDYAFLKKDVLSSSPQAEGGTGIGLYLSKQLMLLQKGDVSVLSSSDKGTTICIKIPLGHPKQQNRPLSPRPF